MSFGDDGEVRVHTIPYVYVEHRGWSQELHILHLEHSADASKRYTATGRMTPLDDPARQYSATGATPQAAVDNFKKLMQTAPYLEFYDGIIKRIDDKDRQLAAKDAEIANLNAQLAQYPKPEAERA